VNTLITTAIGLVAGILKDIIVTSMDRSAKREEALLAANKLEIKDRQAARKLQVPHVQWTRRFIAIAIVSAVAILPAVQSFINPDLTIQIPVTTTGNFFETLLFGAQEKLKYITVPISGYFIVLLDSLMLILGFYFGSGGTRKR